MSNGNPGTPTPATGDPAPDEEIKTDCQKLDEKNKKERATVVEKLKAEDELNKLERETLDKAESTRMTFSSALSMVPGAKGVFTACSSGCAQTFNPSGIGAGGTGDQKMGKNKEARANPTDEIKEKSGVLCDKRHIHPGGGKGGHAEAKIINDMTNLPGSNMRGGSVLLSIDWRFNSSSKTADTSGMPCATCHAMLCKAAKECEIEIFICDEAGEKQPLGDCDADDAYEKLCWRVDKNPSPGRSVLLN